MASIPTSTVDGGADVNLIQPSQDAVAQPPAVENAASIEVASYKSKKSNPVDWNPTDYLKDAGFFKLVHGLPDEGIAPHKIADITEEQLTKVFGESTKNGYKLHCVQGIPPEDILALSQVVDGYDKPVNGMLSHTFAKGVFADLKQDKKVNWAAYAATKLKGQLTQWCRDGKGKPEGPPCVRKPQRYVRHNAAVPKPNRVDPVERPKESLVKQPIEDRSARMHWSPNLQLPIVQVPVEKREHASPRTNPLISIMESEMCNTLNRLQEVKEKFATVQNSVDKLKNYEVEYSSMEKTLEAEVERLRFEERDLVAQIKVEDDAIEELTTDIELESNKIADGDGDGDRSVSDEVTADLLKFMTDNLNVHNDTVKALESQRTSIQSFLSLALGELDRKVKKRPDTPETFSRLSRLSAALAVERVKIESDLKAQEVEFQIVSRVFSSTCPSIVIPCYTPTSTETVCSEVDVSTCPICCNGYHCFNWIPASCGHTFHPACLFASISICTGAPNCYLCGEAFSHDWLQSWGIERGKGYEVREDTSLPGQSMFTAEMKNLYGEKCGNLALRRQCLKNLDKNIHLKAKRCIASTVMLSSTVDTLEGGEGGSSRPVSKGLIVPKVEGEMKKRRSTGDVESTKPSKTRKALSRNTPAF